MMTGYVATLALAFLGPVAAASAAGTEPPRIVVASGSGEIAGRINSSLYETPCDFLPLLPWMPKEHRTDNVAEFLGVPYAAPPVGPDRFRPPRAGRPWPNVLEAGSPGPQCAQLPANAIGNVPDWVHSTKEDCLYLNVWAPVGTDGAIGGGGRPVLVFFHGGGFVGGSGFQESNCAFYNGQGLASDLEAVVVTVNYRLGIFGFLADPSLLAESGTTGNYGLQDQRAALEWMKRNAAAFGGDPARITIMGQSAGGASVLHHTALPRSHGLASRAIAMSGYTLTWSLDQAYGRAEQASSLLGCGDASTRLSCLKEASVSDLLKVERTMLFVSGMDIVQRMMFFGPVSDGFELPENISFNAALRASKQRVPLLVGSTLNETNLFECFSLSSDMSQQASAEYLLKNLKAFMPSSTLSAEAVAGVLRDRYAGYSGRGAAMAMSTDVLFTCAADRAARWFARDGALVYRYVLASPPKLMAAQPCLGAPHVADTFLLFYKAFNTFADGIIVGDANMQALTRYMIDAWRSFIYGSEPAGWSPFLADDPAARTLQLGDNETAPFRELQGYRREACDAIEDLIDPVSATSTTGQGALVV